LAHFLGERLPAARQQTGQLTDPAQPVEIKATDMSYYAASAGNDIASRPPPARSRARRRDALVGRAYSSTDF
jgi:hypothetical protein